MSTEPDALLTGDDIDAFAISGNRETDDGRPLRPYYGWPFGFRDPRATTSLGGRRE